MKITTMVLKATAQFRLQGPTIQYAHVQHMYHGDSYDQAKAECIAIYGDNKEFEFKSVTPIGEMVVNDIEPYPLPKIEDSSKRV